MQVIKIIQPRWHDRKVLVAKWKVGEYNQILINHSSFKQPLYMSGQKIRNYPIERVERKHQPSFEVYAVPIDDFETFNEQEAAQKVFNH